MRFDENMRNRLEVWQLKKGGVMMIEPKEVEWFGLVSMWFGMIVFVVVCSWDAVAGSMLLQHSAGLGWQQIVVLSFSGLYSLWAWSINAKWKEYQKMIKGMLE